MQLQQITHDRITQVVITSDDFRTVDVDYLLLSHLQVQCFEVLLQLFLSLRGGLLPRAIVTQGLQRQTDVLVVLIGIAEGII